MALAVLPDLSAATATAPGCPGPGAEVLERFTSAECSDCRATAAPAAATGNAWLFDWIRPTPAGADVPISAAAKAQERERALRSGEPSPLAQPQRVQRSTLPVKPSVRLEVQAGPAWHGYFGVQLKLRGHVPSGAGAWMALIERQPASADGNVVAREWVRSVAGPLPLQALRPDRPLTHLNALRWPDGASPEGLHARAWVEAADGRILAVAAAHCALRR